MNDHNVCIFTQIPSHDGIHILHFVNETKLQKATTVTTLKYYRLHIVASGEGVLHTEGGDYPVVRGDVFFACPDCPYSIEGDADFSYMYVGYIGERARDIAGRLSLSALNSVYGGYSHLIDIWRRNLELKGEMSEMYIEATLLLTVAEIAEGVLSVSAERVRDRVSTRVKKYIDEHFADPILTLNTICKELCYSPKYLSNAFKREMGIAFKEYLTTVRINNALSLMRRGYVGVKDISFLSGFSDPLYFSKVFKERYGLTPSDAMAELKIQESNGAGQTPPAGKTE